MLNIRRHSQRATHIRFGHCYFVQRCADDGGHCPLRPRSDSKSRTLPALWSQSNVVHPLPRRQQSLGIRRQAPRSTLRSHKTEDDVVFPDLCLNQRGHQGHSWPHALQVHSYSLFSSSFRMLRGSTVPCRETRRRPPHLANYYRVEPGRRGLDRSREWWRP